MSCIPEELVFQIFLRLPVKSILRFRCVSKSFCALINSPHFVKRFLDHSLRTSSDFDIVIENGRKLYSLKFPSVKNLGIADATELDYPFKDPTREVFIVGSCSGILCLHTKKSGTPRFRELILWNRSTGKYRKVEPPKFFEYQSEVSTYFGYDHVKDDYNLVSISSHQGSFDMEVYSLKTDSWKEIKFPYQACWTHVGVFLHGAVHWLVGSSKYVTCRELILVAFDLGTETFRRIPLPNQRSRIMSLYDLGGRLCLVNCEDYSGSCTSYLWVMEDYGVAQSWTQLFAAETYIFAFFKPIAFYPKGSKQVLGIDRTVYRGMLYKDLKWCLPEQRRLELILVRGLPDRRFYS